MHQATASYRRASRHSRQWVRTVLQTVGWELRGVTMVPPEAAGPPVVQCTQPVRPSIPGEHRNLQARCRICRNDGSRAKVNDMLARGKLRLHRARARGRERRAREARHGHRLLRPQPRRSPLTSSERGQGYVSGSASSQTCGECQHRGRSSEAPQRHWSLWDGVCRLLVDRFAQVSARSRGQAGDVEQAGRYDVRHITFTGAE